MIVRFDGKPSKPFESFSYAHKEEVLKYFNPEHPEKILELINPEFMKSPTTCEDMYAKDKVVRLNQFRTVPTLLHLSSLCQLSTTIRVSKDPAHPFPTADVIVSLYSNSGLFTVLASEIKLIPENRVALWRISQDILDFKADYRNIANLSELDKRLFLVLNIGLEVDVKKRPGYTNIKVVYAPTGMVVTDRSFLTYTKKELKHAE